MKNKNPKIVFMGTPYFGSQILDALLKANFNIIGVITQPEKKSGRGKKICPSDVKILAMQNKLPIFEPQDKVALTNISSKLKPELIVVAAYGKIIPKEVLGLPKYGSLNVHGSILPKFRGSSCIAQSILEGDKFTGITIMEVSEEMDAGNIISSAKTPITEIDTTQSLTERLAKLGAAEITKIIPLWIEGKISSCKQCHTEASYCKLITKNDGKIDWTKKAEEIERETRAYYPWPSAFTTLEGKNTKILKTKISDKIIDPGKILVIDKRMYVGTGEKSLELLSVQPEGKKPMSAKDFLNGYPDITGKTFI